MAYSVNLVFFPEQPVAYIRERGPLADLPKRIERLFAALDEAGVKPQGPVMARYFENDMEATDLDYEVAVPIETSPDGSVPQALGEARGDVLPAYQAVVTHHGGPYHELHMGYTALTEELNALGYAVAGPAIEIYVRGPESTSDPDSYVTELRLPVVV